MNIEWKFAVFALNLMILFQERVKLLVALFLELLNIFALEYKACLEHKACLKPVWNIKPVLEQKACLI